MQFRCGPSTVPVRSQSNFSVAPARCNRKWSLTLGKIARLFFNVTFRLLLCINLIYYQSEFQIYLEFVCFFCRFGYECFIWWNRLVLGLGAVEEEEDGPFELRVCQTNEVVADNELVTIGLVDGWDDGVKVTFWYLMLIGLWNGWFESPLFLIETVWLDVSVETG